MRINHAAANELHQIPKAPALHVRDHVQNRNLEAVREAVRVHVRALLPVRGRHLGLGLDLDLSLDLGPEVFRDQEVAQHPGQPKAGQDRGRVHVRAAHDQGLTAAREEVDQSQDQGRVRERAVLGRSRRAVQGKVYHHQGLDPKAARVQARRNVDREARVDRDLNRSPSRDLSRDREAAADRDHAPGRRAVPEAGVQVDRHGMFYFIYLFFFLMQNTQL